MLATIAMAMAVLGLLFPGFCSGQPLTPAETLDRYLASRDQQPPVPIPCLTFRSTHRFRHCTNKAA
jgi:hypothetical protein